MVYCSEASLVNYGDGKCRAITLFCRSWQCDICLPRRKSQLVKEACDGYPQRLLTLTTRRDPDGDAVAEAKRQGVAFGRLIQRMRRSYPKSKIEYFAVREATKAGWPHIHVLLRGPYVDWKVIRKWWLEFSGSPGIDIRKIWNPAKAAKYVAKYIGKSPHQFGTCKRYWKSKGWVSLGEGCRNEDRGWDRKWYIVGSPIHELKELYWLRRWELVATGRSHYMEARRPP